MFEIKANLDPDGQRLKAQKREMRKALEPASYAPNMRSLFNYAF
jgi:hypothetical protein